MRYIALASEVHDLHVDKSPYLTVAVTRRYNWPHSYLTMNSGRISSIKACLIFIMPEIEGVKKSRSCDQIFLGVATQCNLFCEVLQLSLLSVQKGGSMALVPSRCRSRYSSAIPAQKTLKHRRSVGSWMDINTQGPVTNVATIYSPQIVQIGRAH